MPTYEYACSKCGEHLEVVQSFTDDPLKKCPACGGRLKKVFGAVGIVFKGSGFYKTDSRGASSSSITSDSGESKSAASAKNDGAKADGAKADSAKSDSSKSEKKTPVSEGSTTTTKSASTDAAS
jgi:putative FmdB family regulatory protein